MDRRYYILKIGIVVVALASAGAVGGFSSDGLNSRIDTIHYRAAATASIAVQQTAQTVTHAALRLFGR